MTKPGHSRRDPRSILLVASRSDGSFRVGDEVPACAREPRAAGGLRDRPAPPVSSPLGDGALGSRAWGRGTLANRDAQVLDRGRKLGELDALDGVLVLLDGGRATQDRRKDNHGC